MLNFNSILLSTDQPKVMIEFYTNVFGKKTDWAEDNWAGFQVGSGFFSIGPHDKVRGASTLPERILFNFETTEVSREFDRIEKLGTKVVAKPYEMGGMKDMWIATFSDPDGNYFQLMSPMK